MYHLKEIHLQGILKDIYCKISKWIFNKVLYEAKVNRRIKNGV